MTDFTYYADSSVQITSDWVKLGEKTYRVSDIKSAKVWSTQADPMRELPYFLLIAGSFTMFALNNFRSIFPRQWESMIPFVLAFGMIIGLAGFGILLAQMFRKSEYIYILRLTGTFGTTSPFASDDERYVQKIADAMQLALSNRQVEAPQIEAIGAEA
ncbi:MAG TPA: DUF6232 family protein [Chloroflexia bacterium]|nr:DUF6232 family protein [Chloroflexia bacterium]